MQTGLIAYQIKDVLFCLVMNRLFYSISLAELAINFTVARGTSPTAVT
jgi:hypothetical protein